MLTRRRLLSTSLAASATPAFLPGAAPRDLVVASSNGLACCNKAMDMLKAGADTLDAVIAGVNINEEDPNDTGVGYGGLPNEDGVVQLDASVMHGPTRRAGSVACLEGIKTPSKVAKIVMEQTDHVMLVGRDALRFAELHGFQRENLLTEKARLAWRVWKESLRDGRGHNNWGPGLDAPSKPQKKSDLQERFPGVDSETLAWAWEASAKPPLGTINCLALNRKGELSGVTTTSGLAWKIAGRVGDSPIIGAGLYVDQDAGAAGSTGRGEENIRVCGAHTIVEAMRRGMHPREACLEALHRVSRNYNNDRDRLKLFSLSFYAIRKDGEYGAASLWGFRDAAGKTPSRFVVNDGSGARHENAAWLYERP